MVERINDISWQAHQGSVAAIIQVLNEKLGSSGIRTRAIFDNGVLQLLCEARTGDKLEQSTLVKQIQQILESIAPRNIHRVNINSRIVREQQLLWLEEINRNPENQLLWSQEIILEQPNIFQQITIYFQRRKTELGKPNFPKSLSSHPIGIINNKQNNSFRGQMLISLSICLFLLILTWAIYAFLNTKLKNSVISETPRSANTKQEKPQDQTFTPTQSASIPEEDPFAAAVRIANQATTTGKIAKTSTQWLEIAANWQRASDLMNKVPLSHGRYKEAQLRAKLYQQYSKVAQKEA
ncbi:hypothetical protein, partial [Mastigocladopsis repens]